jgi:hypothetical protein
MSELLLVRPPTPKTASIARISFDGAMLRCFFPEKREDFNQIVKCHNLRWQSPYFVREITDDTDRLNWTAELIHALLAGGFCVKADESLVHTAVNQSYTKEPRRTVSAVRTDHSQYGGWFRIWWHRDEDCYQVAKRLPGARYAKPVVVVPPDSFAEVLDFAERHEFLVRPSALRVADAARAELEAALVVSVAAPVEPEVVRPSTKPPKLEVPDKVAIDESLLDD